MDKYLMMLYVTLDQERALKQFFIEHGWLFSKPDLCVTTDKLGPLLTLSTSNTEDFDQSITTSEHSIDVPVSQTEGTKSNKKRKKPTKLSRSPASKQSKSEQSLHNVGDLTKTHHGTILTQTRSSNTSQSSAISNLSEIHSQSVNNVDDNTSTTPSSSSGVLAHEPNDTNVDFPLTLQCSNEEQVVVKLENVEDIEDEELEQPVHQMNQTENSEIENVDNNEDYDPENSNDFSDNTMEHHDDTMNEVLGLGAALDTDSKSTMLKPCTSSKQEPPQKRKRLLYDRENLQRAYEATLGGMSAYRAAKLFSIPPTTLRDRISGRVASDARAGHETIFTREEEKKFFDHITYMAEIGFGYNKTAIQYMAKDFSTSLEKFTQGEKLSDNWFYGFTKRWPELKTVKPKKHSSARAKSASRETMDIYYKELEVVLSDNNIKDKPWKIFNIDEICVNTEYSPPKIVCNKHTIPQNITSSRSATSTVIAAGNAAGQSIPPYYVFPGEIWSEDFLKGSCPGSAGEMSKTCWSNSAMFLNYLTKHFLQFVTTDDEYPTLILYDGHRSHLSLTLTEWARQHNIILFVLPPNSSHLNQPLDVGIFEPFKKMFSQDCLKHMNVNACSNITKYDIAELTSKPYLEALTPENLISAFRRTGIYPSCNSVINDAQVTPFIYDCHDETEETSTANQDNAETITCSEVNLQPTDVPHIETSSEDITKAVKTKP